MIVILEETSEGVFFAPAEAENAEYTVIIRVDSSIDVYHREDGLLMCNAGSLDDAWKFCCLRRTIAASVNAL